MTKSNTTTNKLTNLVQAQMSEVKGLSPEEQEAMILQILGEVRIQGDSCQKQSG